jgi:hypothetical protein
VRDTERCPQVQPAGPGHGDPFGPP